MDYNLVNDNIDYLGEKHSVPPLPLDEASQPIGLAIIRLNMVDKFFSIKATDEYSLALQLCYMDYERNADYSKNSQSLGDWSESYTNNGKNPFLTQLIELAMIENPNDAWVGITNDYC